jgi:hypothetical protein
LRSAVLLGFACSVAFYFLVPSIAVNNLDAFSYIEGARSLSRGTGYLSVDGHPLNHWPPGYSWILSFFTNPLAAAYWINLVSLGISAAFLLQVACAAGWSVPAARAFSAATGFGFLFSLATHAQPDILAYAIFFVATFAVISGRVRARHAGFLALALLPLLKTIALVFLPAFVLGEVWHRGIAAARTRGTDYVLGTVALIASTGGLLLFNYFTIGDWVSSTHPRADPSLLLRELGRFPWDVFRYFLAPWYGSIRRVEYLSIFALVVATGTLAYGSIRLGTDGIMFRRIGSSVFALSCSLELVRVFYATPRLLGYGMLLFVVGSAPASRSAWRWATYASASLAATMLCSVLVASAGANAPEYAKVVRAIAPSLPSDALVYSNSYRVLDIHLGRHAVPITEWPKPVDNSCVFQILLPNLDAIGTVVWQLPDPPANWTLVADIGTGKLYCRVSDSLTHDARSPGGL